MGKEKEFSEFDKRIEKACEISLRRRTSQENIGELVKRESAKEAFQFLKDTQREAVMKQQLQK